MDILNTKIKSILTEKNTKILPENIKSGVNILGINGSVVELKGETKTITPTTTQQIIIPSSGKNALTQVTVNAVTSAIDNNIVAENIKKDVTILNVTGTFEGGASGYNAKVVTTPISTSYTTFPATNRFLKEFPAVDLTGFNTCQNFFGQCNYLEKVELFDTSNCQSMNSMFINCERLVTVPEFNTTRVTNMQNAFSNCPSLSNDSLNNILAMCYKSAVTSNTNLQKIGLSSAQADICETLPNWSAYIAGGWFKGY